ncbi:MAG: glycosyltransferase family 4 protein [Syntrophobacteraceae bacterium]|nr:glycosyltransferase family 4 protein [Syntrophobacteraceae bacterium]
MPQATILHTEASTGWGGQEIRILREMTGIRERGYRVLLACPPEAARAARAAAAGFEVLSMAMDKRRMIFGVHDLRRRIREHGVDLINTHSSTDSWIGSIAGRLERVAVLRTRHISSRLNGNLFTRLLYGRLCHEVITTGEFIRSQLIRDLKLNPTRVRSIPTGISVSDYTKADGGGVRCAMGIAEDVPVLGIAAVLRSWKGHLVLLEAVKCILQAFPRVKLLIVGNGPMRRAIEDRIRELQLVENVLMTGHREDIADVVDAFDIAVMASYASEGIPQFALQAMASGKPVVATRVGGIPEVVLDRETGLLVDPKDPEGIARAVVELLKDAEGRKRMGERGRQRVVSHHSFERMLDQMEECYRRHL